MLLQILKLAQKVFDHSWQWKGKPPHRVQWKLRNYLLIKGTAVAQWLRRYATNRKVAGSIPDGVIGNFHRYKILPISLWPWGRLSLEQKWVTGVFPGGIGGRCVRLTTLTPSCAVDMKSGKPNFLEPSGPLRACNGTALLFFYYLLIEHFYWS